MVSQAPTNWPELTQLVSYAEVDKALRGPQPAEKYRVLDASKCAALAGCHSLPATLLDTERCLVCSRCGREGAKAAAASCLVIHILALRAAEERNKSAGTALELFYHLAEAHAARELLDLSVLEVDKAIEDYAQLQGRGLRLPDDDTAWRRQRAELLGRRAELAASASDLEGQLCRLMGLQRDPQAPLCAQADLKVRVELIDVEEAVRRGLETRGDLATLRFLAENLDKKTLPVVRGTLRRVDALLGTSANGPLGKLAALCDDGNSELPMRQSQLALLIDDQTEAIELEIRRAARVLQTRLRQAALAKEKLELAERHVRNQRDKRQSDSATPFDVTAAKLEVLREETDALHQAIAWRIAEVKFRQAQGLAACPCASPPEPPLPLERKP